MQRERERDRALSIKRKFTVLAKFKCEVYWMTFRSLEIKHLKGVTSMLKGLTFTPQKKGKMKKNSTWYSQQNIV